MSWYLSSCLGTDLPSWQSTLSFTVPCHLSPLMARCPEPVSPFGKVPCHLSPPMARCPVTYLHPWQGALSLISPNGKVPCHLCLLTAKCPVTYGTLSLISPHGKVPCHLSPLVARCPVTNGALSLISPHGKLPYHLSPLLERACFPPGDPPVAGQFQFCTCFSSIPSFSASSIQ